MRWDRKSKERLYCLLFEKMEQVSYVPPDPLVSTTTRSWEKWAGFFKQFGIVDVARRDSTSSYSDKWMQQGADPDKYDIPAASRKHVTILDPWWGGDSDYGLKIPKDVAERFLVLGVP